MAREPAALGICFGHEGRVGKLGGRQRPVQLGLVVFTFVRVHVLLAVQLLPGSRLTSFPAVTAVSLLISLQRVFLANQSE